MKACQYCENEFDQNFTSECPKCKRLQTKGNH